MRERVVVGERRAKEGDGKELKERGGKGEELRRERRRGE